MGVTGVSWEICRIWLATWGLYVLGGGGWMQDDALTSRNVVRAANRTRRFGVSPARRGVEGDEVVVFMTVIGDKRMT